MNPGEAPPPVDPARIRQRLAAGLPVLDAAFDGLLPEALRRPSARHWTSVAVASLASQWLEAAGAARVLDLGSGAGKFCTVGALTSGLAFTGLEHRAALVAAARDLARDLGVAERVTFRAEAAPAEPPPGFDALYLYNPFGENLLAPAGHLDGTVELNRRRFNREVARFEAWLDRLPPGTHLMTLNGFGGRIPDSFDLLQARDTELAPLRHWRKARRRPGGAYWLELEDTTLLRHPDGSEACLPLPAGGAGNP